MKEVITNLGRIFSFPLKNRSVLDNKDTQTKLGGNIPVWINRFNVN
jgi:hypothetical protein